MSRKDTKKAADLQPETTETAPQETPAAPATVRVRVGAQAINEGGHREPGAVFEISSERRAALGSLVEDAPQ